MKIEFDEDLAEKPEIFDQIVNTRIIGIPQKDTVKLKVQGTPYLGKIIEDEQVQYIRQYFQKARVSRIAPRIYQPNTNGRCRVSLHYLLFAKHHTTRLHIEKSSIASPYNIICQETL